MADDPNHQQNKANAARQQRLSAALRANLKRRKQQARARATESTQDQAGSQGPAPENGTRDRTEP